MSDDGPARRLATIVSVDVAGYSARVESDEAKTTTEIADLHGKIQRLAERHGGRVFNTAGDGFMLEFGSSLAGLTASIALAEMDSLPLRIGVHLGDVVVQPNGDLLGHGVNVAARIMARCVPGQVLVSAAVRQTVRGGAADQLTSVGTVQLAKMAEKIEVYSFTPDATTDRDRASLGTERPADHAPSGPTYATRSDAVTIAVLPFEAASQDPADAPMVRGLAVEIGNALNQVGRLRAVPSLLAGGAASSDDLRTLAREWGVRYALTGSLIRRGNDWRISVQLVQIDDGTQVWSDTYRESDADLFEIQHQVAENTARTVGGEVIQLEYNRVVRSGTSSTNAWALTAHSAHMIIERGGGANAWDEAIDVVERALALAPNYGAAHARLAALCAERGLMLASPDPIADHGRALSAARRAVELSGNDPYALMSAAQGFVACGEVQRGLRMLERALRMIPHDLLARTFYWNACVAAMPDEDLQSVITETHQAATSHPSYPLAGVIRGITGLCYLRLGEIGRAMPCLDECFHDSPGFPVFGLALAAALQTEGSQERAREVLGEINRLGFRATQSYLSAASCFPSLAAPAAVLIPICEP